LRTNSHEGIKKKKAKMRVCINFRDLNKAIPKDEYPILITNMLVVGNEILSLIILVIIKFK